LGFRDDDVDDEGDGEDDEETRLGLDPDPGHPSRPTGSRATTQTSTPSFYTAIEGSSEEEE
jgi:hypothetical protein